MIIYVCDNDASNGTDIGYFEEVYDQTIQLIKETNNQCQIKLCTSCPRRDTRLSEVNVIIRSLAQYYHVSLIDQNRAFHDWNGNVIICYQDTDCIHLSSSGVKSLLGIINQEIAIVNHFQSVSSDSVK